MRQTKRPVHPFLPPDEDRNTAIVAIARVRYDDKVGELTRSTLTLPSHRATFTSRPRHSDILITYTPIARSNMQTSDAVRV